MVSMPKEFRASLESYNGPLDLLLYLIKKEEVDVFDIPIAQLVQQFQIYLDVLQEIDPNSCGDFLVMAARLMEIKSKLLLPREVLEEDDEEYEDPRMDLVRQLLEYKKFKERAILLEKRLHMHRKRYQRPRQDVPVGEEGEPPPLNLGNVSVWDLLTAFHRIQIALGQRGPHQVMLEERPQEDFIRDVVEYLSLLESRTAPFEDLFQGAGNRQEACGYFLAILQLAKEYRITLEQESELEPIYVRLRDEDEARRMREEERQRELEYAELEAERGQLEPDHAELEGEGQLEPESGLVGAPAAERDGAQPEDAGEPQAGARREADGES